MKIILAVGAVVITEGLFILTQRSDLADMEGPMSLLPTEKSDGNPENQSDNDDGYIPAI
ncbi:MAG: hypothetical protein PQ612_09080 [Rickettsiales bacterium]|nr:hypothetical protein [Pseudomonadota bacterium]MDG4544126.1 hypothetical protein [Rickettsiales bacterium]MDG4546307.1 hypothetical protein [Rickettsiales bacterium]MDG4548450.1 hypothetical protein [Rickettsiales bacterium]